jgi:hypothetical protein
VNDTGGNLFGSIPLSPVHDGHAGTFRGKQFRYRPTNAATPAGYYGHLSVQSHPFLRISVFVLPGPD